jgi:lipoprotein-anchoring transpeptidase ErfK/SrfK
MPRSSRTLISGVVALFVVAAAISYAVTTSGPFGPHRIAQSKPSAQPRTPAVQTAARARHAPVRVTGATANVKAGSLPRPRRRTSRAAVHPLPWKRDGTSLVARTRDRWLAVYTTPRVKRATMLLRNPDSIGTPRILLVQSQRRAWIRVYLPTRPNGGTGWIQRRSVRLLRNPYRIVIHVRRHRLDLWERRRLVLRARTVVGRPGTPTPLGLFYVVDLLRPPDPHGSYGPFTFDLSAHSAVLREFAGGDGHVAIHGTNEPWLLGQSVSHGCIRVRNGIIRRLARFLPLGTPVLIRA